MVSGIPKLATLAFLASLLPSLAAAAPIVRQSGGADAAAITPAVNAFRADLGTLNPNQAGSFGSGRREINWDGTPNQFAAPNNLPPDFFNVNSPRGAVFSTPGSAVQVSANAGVAPIEFDNINGQYSEVFTTFSPQRLFTPIGSNIVDVLFFVPGSTTPARVSGFGAVFTDVDLVNTTRIDFFADNSLVFSGFVPPGTTANESLSFLGVSFSEGAIISRVRITNGNSALGPSEAGGLDLVVMDDFIYGEPIAAQQIPEPHALLLLALMLGLTAWRVRRRQAA